jgi:hypothetical protein
MPLKVQKFKLIGKGNIGRQKEHLSVQYETNFISNGVRIRLIIYNIIIIMTKTTIHNIFALH